ncbi:hypothetical protein WKI65_39525 [Streptomyces sp. MS1.AVA.3]|uniref:hypothetical protein n=1 Tax=Streptomyces decoyicus TaxID=249567 RepID=UPI0030BDA3F7
MRRAMMNLRFPRRGRDRRGAVPDFVEGMNHVEETYAMTYAREAYERAGHADFDRRVAAATGSFGWQNVNLLVLSAACLAVALLTGLHHLGWWAYPLGGAGVLCAGLVLLRWRLSRRAPGRGRAS